PPVSTPSRRLARHRAGQAVSTFNVPLFDVTSLCQVSWERMDRGSELPQEVDLNGRRYRRPRRPNGIVCIDGVDPAYLTRGMADGIFPAISAFQTDGFMGTADAVVPTFTNPNNTSIVTGAPPSVHGMSGNYYLERETGREVMVTDAHLLRSETIL